VFLVLENLIGRYQLQEYILSRVLAFGRVAKADIAELVHHIRVTPITFLKIRVNKHRFVQCLNLLLPITQSKGAKYPCFAKNNTPLAAICGVPE
jgi:hypothetical protein